jgi:hypothetical protein
MEGHPTPREQEVVMSYNEICRCCLYSIVKMNVRLITSSFSCHIGTEKLATVSTMRIGSVRQDLQSSTFYFQGKEKVTQPSLLQTYIRTEKAEEGLGGSNSNKVTLVGH